MSCTPVLNISIALKEINFLRVTVWPNQATAKIFHFDGSVGAESVGRTYPRL